MVQVVHTNFCVPRGPRFGGAAGRGPPRHANIDSKFFSARMDHYENIFEVFFLPARTITKIFSKRFFFVFCPPPNRISTKSLYQVAWYNAFWC